MFYLEKKEASQKQSELLDRLMSRTFEEYKYQTTEPDEEIEEEKDDLIPLSDIDDIENLQEVE